VPRVVDAVERRREIAEAVWRVIVREGLDHVSVRSVAREAGVSMGSLRHYFLTQAELLSFAMRTVMDRIERRLAALTLPDDPRAAAETALAELLPLDSERAVENEVWLAFTARAMVDPGLRSVRDEAHDRLRSGCQRWVRLLVPDGTTPARVELETDRLFALLDGLAVHAAVRPQEAISGRLTAVLHHHLGTIATS
jgi:AcrR family transcriptional regulator